MALPIAKSWPSSTPTWLREMLVETGIQPCADNSCMFGSPGGMATNGGCRCIERLDGPRMSPEQRLYIRRLVHVLRCVAVQVTPP